ncbi:MAG TPA: cache domain-containing protein [Armatimonadota bacterium]|nr:cache domain-containing protein [Armatimonadota bacterium]HPO74265.1 cache domain-containing protein [Armatimonadota bacterium]
MTLWIEDPKRYWERISFVRRAFSVLSALSLLVTLALAVSFYRENRAAQDRVLERASEQTRHTGNRLDGVCRRVMHVADTLAADLSRARISEDRLLDRLRVLQRSHAVVYSAGVRYAPFKRSSRRHVFSPYIVRGTGGEEPSILWREEGTDEENKWFSRALAEGPLWGEPRFAPEAKRLIITYYAPFTREDKETGAREPIGVVEISCSANDLAALLFSFDLGAPGYAFLTTRTGRFLCAPASDWIRDGKSVASLAAERNDAALASFAASGLQGKPFCFRDIDRSTGRPAWYIGEPIPSSGWVLGSVTDAGPLWRSEATTARRLLQMEIAALLFLLTFLGARLAETYAARRRALLWTGSAVASLAIAAAIAHAWCLAYTLPPEPDARLTPVFTRAGHGRLLRERLQQAREGGEEPAAVIPTGLILRSLAFSGASDVEMAGEIWQQYDRIRHEGVPRGVRLLGTLGYTLSDERREEAGNTEWVRWQFRARLRGGHDYRHYPFDHQQTVVGVAPPEGETPIILVPDVASYDRLHPAACPGIAADVQLTGREIERSFFAYLPDQPGEGAGAQKGKLPALGFVVQTRHSVPAIVADTLVVLLAMIAALFLLLFVIARPARGSVALSAIFTAASLLLALVAHMTLRHHHPVPQMTYAGYLCITLYAVVLVASAIAGFAGRRDGEDAEEARLLPSLLLGPGSLALLYIVTLAVLR